MSPLAIGAITIGVLVLCLGLMIAAGALDELVRRKLRAKKQRAASSR